jgi:hypothetical protein
MSICEVTQMLQDKNIIKNDLEQAFSLVKDMFYKKYLDKIQLEIKNKRENLKINRPKELELLYALKPFIPKEKNYIIDNTAEYLIILNIIRSLQAEINSDVLNKNNKFISTQSKDSSEHQDGIYDLDKNCLDKKNSGFINAFLMLVVFSAF